MAKVWPAAEAEGRFPELLDAAVDGEPQFVRRPDGREAVVVSRDYFDKTRPPVKSYLLTGGFAEDGEDAFDHAMDEIRQEGVSFSIAGRGDLDR